MLNFLEMLVWEGLFGDIMGNFGIVRRQRWISTGREGISGLPRGLGVVWGQNKGACVKIFWDVVT